MAQQQNPPHHPHLSRMITYQPSQDQPHHATGRVAVVRCPRNFAGTFGGCALVQHNVFHGWVTKDDKNVTLPRLLANHCVIARVCPVYPASGATFDWNEGGGRCYSGQIEWTDYGKSPYYEANDNRFIRFLDPDSNPPLGGDEYDEYSDDEEDGEEDSEEDGDS